MSDKARVVATRFSSAKPAPEGAWVRSPSTHQRPSEPRPSSKAQKCRKCPPAGLVPTRGRKYSGLIAASPEYLRPLVGTRPAGGHFLHFCAFELGRGSDGRWWVLGDRTQAPSGAGFALENRVATTRALSDIYGEMH